MDPPGDVAASNRRQPPQPFEIALVRKLESKTATVREAFLFLDADGDSRISPSDARVVLHNELGLDMTRDQEDRLFARSSSRLEGGGRCAKVDSGMGYAEFAKYFHEVSSASYPASQSGLAAAVGFCRNVVDEKDDSGLDREMTIRLCPHTVLHQRRHQLRQLLSAHSTRENKGKDGMKDTFLFLAMDVHRSGKVTMDEFLHWLNTVGVLQWTMEELKQVVMGDGDDCGTDIIERQKLVSCWFGDPKIGEVEAGMTEHEFAEFVESLDVE